jgi:PAS domain-containing protein
MGKHGIDIDRQWNLRQRALSHLATPAKPGAERATQSQALAILYELASSPDTAADALALLHELQVHQVELDLQEDELRRSRSELESMLQRKSQLYDWAPMAYLTLDATLAIQELNSAAAQLLGCQLNEAPGRSLRNMLPASAAAALQDLLARLPAGAAPGSCEFSLVTAEGLTRRLHARAVADPLPGNHLVALLELGATASAEGS